MPARTRSARIIGRDHARQPFSVVKHVYGSLEARYDPAETYAPAGYRYLDQQKRDFWRYGMDEAFSNSLASRSYQTFASRLQPFTEDDFKTFQRSVQLVHGDAYKLFTIDVMEGPRIWYEQLPDNRKVKQDDWVEALSHINGLVMNDENWDGPAFKIDELPPSYNRSSKNLPGGAHLVSRTSA